MKTEISRDSHQPQKRYSGVYQQQGRMLTDADWNELVEILKARLNDALKDVVGSRAGSTGGMPRHRALKIVADALTTFKIMPGHIYVDGMAAEIIDDTAFLYNAQSDYPSPPTPTGDYILYADVWERTVTHLMDERLRDKGLHGADTCTRKQTMAQVKWCSNTIDPEQSDKNPKKGDAELSLTLLHKTTESDPCDPCAAQLEVESKVGNYLFRVEVHDVKGDADSPDEITLKWSSENGAVQFEALSTKEEMPAGFISDKWVYEFFDMTSERHLGVHFGSSSWEPSRGVLEEIKEPSDPYAVPTIPGSSETKRFVRRWDGYCTLDLTSNTLVEGVDRGVALSTTKDVNAPGYVEIDSTSLEINLAGIHLNMVLDGKKFVVGDYWLADVREAEHDPLDAIKSKLIENECPLGIEHHYLVLGEVIGAALQPNAEADRKYAFPSLSEMTRMFMAGGDGQEVMPGETLPQPLRVGVANGEWPVEGAKVRFQIEEGGGSLNPIDDGKTNAYGFAECEWTPDAVVGDKCRVKATLVDPEHESDASSDIVPPVFFYANLVTADQVAYEPGCAGSGQDTVHGLLATDSAVSLNLGTDGYYTVKEVLDALLCKLRAKHIPYAPGCSDSDPNTVHGHLADDASLDLGADGCYTIKEVFDALLCKLAAKHLPYDPTFSAEDRWIDINESASNLPQTVQDAIDQLVNNLEASDVRYVLPPCDTTDYGVPTFKELIKDDIVIEPDETNPKIKALWDAVLCLLDAEHIPYDYKKEETRWEDVIDETSPVFPMTVQSAIDLLLTALDSSDIAYQLPDCIGAVDSIHDRLLPGGDRTTVREVLNALLCKLDASNIPFSCNTFVGSLMEGFVIKTGDKMTGRLSIDDGSSDQTNNLLDVNGKARIRGSIRVGENNHRYGKIRLWQESNDADEFVSHAIGTVTFHNVYGAGVSYPNSVGHKFYRGKEELIAQIGFGGSGEPKNRLDSFFQGRIGIGTSNKFSMLTVKGKGIEFKTGTVEVTEGSNVVKGTGTFFLSEVGIGDYIYVPGQIPSDDQYEFRTVTDIINNTELIVHEEFKLNKRGVWFILNSLFRIDGHFADSANEILNPIIVSPSGYVGINTITPSYRLHTNGTSYAVSRAGGGIDYAEYFESLNGKEIPHGTTVVFEKGMIRKAKKGEVPIGVISANPIIVGGVHAEWPKKYLRDELGCLIMEEYQDEIMVPKKNKITKERQKLEKKTIEEEVTRKEIVFENQKYCQKEITEKVTREVENPVFKEVDLYDATGKNVIGRHQIPVMESYEEETEVLKGDAQPVLVGTGKFLTKKRPKLNPDYNESQEYIPREKRPEWNCVGLLGQLPLLKGQPVAPTWVKISDISDKVELWLIK